MKVTDKDMTTDPHFSLREFLGNAWAVHRGDGDYHVEILFDAEADAFIEESNWHHTQELEREKDGSPTSSGGYRKKRRNATASRL